MKHKLRKIRQQVLDDAVAAVSLARNYTDDIEFSAEDATRTDPDYLEQVSQAVVEAGARTVNFPDTVGFSVPDEYGELIGRMVQVLGDRAIVSVHCHDDLGLAIANSLAAVKAGARQVECTINGIGERAGNAALEEVVVAMKTRPTSCRSRPKFIWINLFGASQTLTQFISFGPQPNKAIVGENAFAHEAGIHQDGYLKNPATYEIVSPASVGVPASRLVLGKHSGRHALKDRAADLGFQLSKQDLDVVYRALHQLADNKKGVRNEEIASLIEEVVGVSAHATVTK